MSTTALVRAVARAVCRVFYRVDQAGAPPSSGAVLLVANHPNALLDPAVVWATAGRDVRFLAKSTLFDGPLKPILVAARAIPIYRRQDEAKRLRPERGAKSPSERERGWGPATAEMDTARNAEMFAAVGAALAAGDAVCIFPEGLSHSAGRLVALRTGAARIALAAEADGTHVDVVAVGLNFDRKAHFRSRVTVAFGAPFAARDLAADGHDPEAVRALTERIAGHMRSVLVEADPGADASLVDRVARLYASARGGAASADEQLLRRRAIAQGIEQLRAADRQRYDEILLRIRRYDARLRRFGVRDGHLDIDPSAREVVRFALRETILALLLGPVALAGLAVFAVPYGATALGAAAATRQEDVTASAKVLAGAAGYAAWCGVLIAGLAWGWGAAAAWIGAALLPVLAVAALFAIERESAVLDTIAAWWTVRRARRGTQALRRRRSELADVLDEAYALVAQVNAATAPARPPASAQTASAPSSGTARSSR